MSRFYIVKVFILGFKKMLVACNKPSGISSFDVVKIIRTHFQDKV